MLPGLDCECREVFRRLPGAFGPARARLSFHEDDAWSLIFTCLRRYDNS